MYCDHWLIHGKYLINVWINKRRRKEIKNILIIQYIQQCEYSQDLFGSTIEEIRANF